MSIISINNLSKTYAGGTHALRGINLDIQEGEIFGLLGPNGAGKTTLIGVITGLVTKTAGEVLVFGKDVEKDYRFTRSVIGLVPQARSALSNCPSSKTRCSDLPISIRSLS